MQSENKTYETHICFNGSLLILSWEDPAKLSSDFQQQMKSMFIDTFFLQYRMHNYFAELSDDKLKENLKNYVTIHHLAA